MKRKFIFAIISVFLMSAFIACDDSKGGGNSTVISTEDTGTTDTTTGTTTGTTTATPTTENVVYNDVINLLKDWSNNMKLKTTLYSSITCTITPIDNNTIKYELDYTLCEKSEKHYEIFIFKIENNQKIILDYKMYNQKGGTLEEESIDVFNTFDELKQTVENTY